MLRNYCLSFSFLALALSIACGDDNGDGTTPTTPVGQGGSTGGTVGTTGGTTTTTGGTTTTTGGTSPGGNTSTGGTGGTPAIPTDPPPASLTQGITPVNDFSVPTNVGVTVDTTGPFVAPFAPTVSGGIATFVAQFPAITPDAIPCSQTVCSVQGNWNFLLLARPEDHTGEEAVMIMRIVSGFDAALITAGTIQGAIQPTASSIATDASGDFNGFVGAFQVATAARPFVLPTAWTAYAVPLVSPVGGNFDPTTVQQIGFQLFYQLNALTATDTAPATTVTVQIALAGFRPAAGGGGAGGTGGGGAGGTAGGGAGGIDAGGAGAGGMDAGGAGAGGAGTGGA